MSSRPQCENSGWIGHEGNVHAAELTNQGLNSIAHVSPSLNRHVPGICRTSQCSYASQMMKQ